MSQPLNMNLQRLKSLDKTQPKSQSSSQQGIQSIAYPFTKPLKYSSQVLDQDNLERNEAFYKNQQNEDQIRYEKAVRDFLSELKISGGKFFALGQQILKKLASEMREQMISQQNYCGNCTCVKQKISLVFQNLGRSCIKKLYDNKICHCQVNDLRLLEDQQKIKNQQETAKYIKKIDKLKNINSLLKGIIKQKTDLIKKKDRQTNQYIQEITIQIQSLKNAKAAQLLQMKKNISDELLPLISVITKLKETYYTLDLEKPLSFSQMSSIPSTSSKLSENTFNILQQKSEEISTNLIKKSTTQSDLSLKIGSNTYSNAPKSESISIQAPEIRNSFSNSTRNSLKVNLSNILQSLSDLNSQS